MESFIKAVNQVVDNSENIKENCIDLKTVKDLKIFLQKVLDNLQKYDDKQKLYVQNNEWHSVYNSHLVFYKDKNKKRFINLNNMVEQKK